MLMEDSLNAEGCFTHETDTHEGLDMRRLVLKPFKKHHRDMLVCDLMCGLWYSDLDEDGRRSGI